MEFFRNCLACFRASRGEMHQRPCQSFLRELGGGNSDFAVYVDCCAEQELLKGY